MKSLLLVPVAVVAVLLLLYMMYRRLRKRPTRYYVGLLLVGLPVSLLAMHVAARRMGIQVHRPTYSTKLPPVLVARMPWWLIFLIDHPTLLVGAGLFVVGMLALFVVTWAKLVVRVLRFALYAVVAASAAVGAFNGYRSAPPGASLSLKLALVVAGARRPLVQLFLYIVSPLSSFYAHFRLLLTPFLRVALIQTRLIAYLVARGLWMLLLLRRLAEATFALILLLSLALVALFDAHLKLAAARRALQDAPKKVL